MFKRAAIIGWCLILAVAWTIYTDSVKSRSPLGALLMTSQPAQHLHNFGTLSQRFSWDLFNAIWERSDALLGYGPVVTIGVLVWVSRERCRYDLAPALLAAYLLPFFLFPTLYEVHAYYAVACGVFLIFAVAMMLTEES